MVWIKIILLVCLKLSGGAFIKEEETSHKFIEVSTIASKLSSIYKPFSIFHIYLAVVIYSRAWFIALKLPKRQEEKYERPLKLLASDRKENSNVYTWAPGVYLL